MKKFVEKIKANKYFIFLLIIFGYFIPLVTSLTNVFEGNFSFWFDPARDLFLALANLSKFSLVGPPSGIPGFFYGPYWIWLLSAAMFFSKDPRIIILLTETIPYFLLFPLVLLQFRKIWGLQTVVIIWILFILSFNGYATQLWNPNLAPLFFLTITCLVLFTDFYQKGIHTYLKVLLIGVLTGLLFNFDISFGICLMLGMILFFICELILKLKKNKKEKTNTILQISIVIVLFFVGFVFMFVPSFAFEYRHGFQQTKIALKTLTSPTPVVNLQGLTKFEILQSFFGSLYAVFKLPKLVTGIFGLGAFIYILSFIKKKKFDQGDATIKLLTFLSVISFSVLLVYLTSKNPVWAYHFISIEIIFFLFLAFFMTRFPLINILLTLYAVFLLILNIIGFINLKPQNILSLTTKEHIVNKIMTDGQGQYYTVFIYNPAIYVYDYAYLFQSKGKVVPYDPSNNPHDVKIVYLVISEGSKSDRNDFINYRTPNNVYATVKTWHTPDGTTILKRVKKQ